MATADKTVRRNYVFYAAVRWASDNVSITAAKCGVRSACSPVQGRSADAISFYLLFICDFYRSSVLINICWTIITIIIRPFW